MNAPKRITLEDTGGGLIDMPRIDKIRIGGKSSNTVTVRYVVGYARQGWGAAEPEASNTTVETVLHTADVTMPAHYVGSIQERDCWRHDSILEHYGMAA